MKGFDAFTHFVVMVDEALVGDKSIRQVVEGFETNVIQLNHLDIDYLLRRCILSDANKKQASQFIGDVYKALYEQYSELSLDSKAFKAHHKGLYILDSITISHFSQIYKGIGRTPKNIMKVTLNTGDGFMAEDELYKNHNISDNLGSSVAYYGSTAYTFTIHLPFGFRINITPSIQASHSESVNRTVASLMDIDGDGLPDLVYSNSDSRLVVHRNLAGGTNLLRTVTQPFGGHINIGYAQTEPSFDMPGRHWVMSSVETTGGYKENGATSSRNEFTYEGGYRDQRMEHTYDALGRQATARAPYEIESGQPFTIKFEYFPKERKAHTIHYTQDGNIDTYTFADSLMRAVQAKQTGVVWNGGSTSKVSIVSGRAVLDAFGRNIASYYPTTKSYGTMEGVYINGAPQGITFHQTDNFTLYPASILTVNKDRFTKHYFIGSRRVASRIGTGTFNNGKRASAIGRGVVTAIAIGTEFNPVVGPLISFGLGATDTLVGDKFYNYMDKKFD